MGIPIHGRLLALALALGGALALPACGVVWDAGGERHALGIGYVAWPLPAAGQATAVSGVDIAGGAVLVTGDAVGVVIGVSRQRVVKLDANRVVTLDCLQCDLAQAHASGGTITLDGERK